MLGLKNVALDIGNVLFDVDVSRFVEELVAQGVYDKYSHAQAFMDGIQAGQDVGLYTMYQAIARFHPSLPDEKLMALSDAWNATASPCEPMLELVEWLLDNEWQVALLSNIGFDHKETIKNMTPQSIWDRCIHHFSCDVGARKPSKLFFLSFLMQYPTWTSSIFLDDREENVMGSRMSMVVGNAFDGQHFALSDFDDPRNAAKTAKKLLLDSVTPIVIS
jgi:FMN phosphatase YigB (HAD superfamily)